MLLAREEMGVLFLHLKNPVLVCACVHVCVFNLCHCDPVVRDG